MPGWSGPRPSHLAFLPLLTCKSPLPHASWLGLCVFPQACGCDPRSADTVWGKLRQNRGYGIQPKAPLEGVLSLESKNKDSFLMWVDSCAGLESSPLSGGVQMTKWLSPAALTLSGQDPCWVLGSHPGGGEKRRLGSGGGLVQGEARHRLWEQLAIQTLAVIPTVSEPPRHFLRK